MLTVPLMKGCVHLCSQITARFLIILNVDMIFLGSVLTGACKSLCPMDNKPFKKCIFSFLVKNQFINQPKWFSFINDIDMYLSSLDFCLILLSMSCQLKYSIIKYGSFINSITKDL